MLKKTGIIIATATAGLLTVGGLAFATSPHQGPARTDYTNIEQGNLGNDCQFAQDGAEVDSLLTGGDSLALAGGAVANAVAPVSAPVQALNCTNVNVTDVVDLNSNNTEETETETEVEDSNNTAVAPAPED